ncbi:MAG: CGNR zinc finger domain-containing protein [Pseudomonadota bacterium]
MSYSHGYPIRLIGGRLALDFVNTADWTPHECVAHEKLNGFDDLEVWLRELGIEASWGGTFEELRRFRHDLRAMLLGAGNFDALHAVNELKLGSLEIAPFQLEGLLAASTISILADRREWNRLKRCPGENCGWLFIDETKNSRRTWCSMESCGNRAKAARHYQRKKLAAARR